MNSGCGLPQQRRPRRDDHRGPEDARARVERVTPLARAKGAEIGVRSVLPRGLQTTVSLWGLDLGVGARLRGRRGHDGALPPEPPRGRRDRELLVAAAAGCRFDADLALSRARFRDSDPAGDRIPGAVETVVSAGASVDDLAGFFGSAARCAYFGPRAARSRTTASGRSSSTLVNVQVGLRASSGACGSRWTSSTSSTRRRQRRRLLLRVAPPGRAGGGVSDIHTHPVAPRVGASAVLYSF